MSRKRLRNCSRLKKNEDTAQLKVRRDSGLGCFGLKKLLEQLARPERSLGTQWQQRFEAHSDFAGGAVVMRQVPVQATHTQSSGGVGATGQPLTPQFRKNPGKELICTVLET